MVLNILKIKIPFFSCSRNEKKVNANDLQDNEFDMISKFSKINFGTNGTPIKVDNKCVDEEVQQVDLYNHL